MSQKALWNRGISLLSDGNSQNLTSGGGRGQFEYVYTSFPLSHDKVPQG